MVGPRCLHLITRRTGFRRVRLFAESRPSSVLLVPVFWRYEQRACSAQTDGGEAVSIYLHIGPSGDCWTGPSIFAAKHLQPGYVKSIGVHEDIAERLNDLLAMIEEDNDLAIEIYDNCRIPERILSKFRK